MAEKAPGLTFDMGRISARDMGKLNKALQTVDTETAAGVFAKIVVDCPWGDPANVDTYLDLPYYGDEKSWQGVTAAMNDAAKNFKKA